ncbi:MAG: hypothetical protein ACJA2Y_000084 [Cycloclasticus pugetii]|jgi:hypothetical protein|uniref:Uncharacterized protein n=2 Tax=Cycloclasticus TaxID=34067 RepID=A0AB33Z107_9GAMM|nr:MULTISPECIES: hypothetical protein [Cycloclasticus]AFT67875.1 hypothetical protein Q91_1841 [Cycloclasticus sp. P1]ATI02583.1 hypothetical protein CPC19_03610 [Cycloclasticus sp. PY97N]EPD12759.1 hypothetical protein L196_07816 [Cycloclasticus pugetii]MBV1899131.1 hypothetical protein [Cycloclasticus sp.]MDF1828980.1 hypothetical protein [Cycloclasticus pugetii]|tara:strand:+ start:9566 stop:9862 length:297 start_codon:yes stop_codon:yes gene_type:complete
MKLFKKKQFTLDMGFSRKEFLSLLENQNKLVYKRDENLIIFTVADQQARLSLGHEGTHKVSSTRLPMLPVSFDFSTMDDEKQAQFMDVFLLKFLRGGG